MRWTYVGAITPGSSGVFTVLFQIPVAIALNVGAATTLGGRYHSLLWHAAAVFCVWAHRSE